MTRLLWREAVVCELILISLLIIYSFMNNESSNFNIIVNI